MQLIYKIIILTYTLIFTNFAFASNPCMPKDIKEIEAYLNKFEKVIIPFSQVSSSKISHSYLGSLLIEKPSKFRVNYDKPHPLVIAGGKNFVSIYDFDLDELSRVDAKDNLFKFLLELNVSLQKSVEIDICEIFDNNIELLVRHKETDQKAKIIFASSPIMLEQMIIPDDGNDIAKGFVRISFDSPKFISKFDENLFILKDVKIYGAPKRYSSEEILKSTK